MSNRNRSVPSSRFSRLAHFGGLAGKVASNVMVAGAKQVLKGERPERHKLLLQSNNIQALADKLSHLRGAAMKLGQLLSMDAGELLPAELSVLLERLRAEATPMPHKQLVQVLKAELGEEWLDKFSHIELQSFAQASIGQVHRGNAENGQALAIKIQYPGVAQSIHSDVDNVMSLIKLSGLLPQELNLEPLVAEAKTQLLNETDYHQEAQYLSQFASALSQDSRFNVPKVFPELSSNHILTMEFVAGEPLETMTTLEQTRRNDMVFALIELFFQELFEIGLMQTDPNFANYLYNPAKQQLVLLDFGATRAITNEIANGYRALLTAALNEDRTALDKAAVEIGYFDADIEQDYRDAVLELFMLATTPLRSQGAFDFGNSNLAKTISEQGMQLSTQSKQWHSPPVDALFIHRKLAGLYLIAAKLGAKVDLTPLHRYLQV